MQRIAAACIVAIAMLDHDVAALTLSADDSGVLGYAEITKKNEELSRSCAVAVNYIDTKLKELDAEHAELAKAIDVIEKEREAELKLVNAKYDDQLGNLPFQQEVVAVSQSNYNNIITWFKENGNTEDTDTKCQEYLENQRKLL